MVSGMVPIGDDDMTTSTLTPWKRPDGYGGSSWNGWLVAPCTQHRDSDALERSNFDTLKARLEATTDIEGLTDPDDDTPDAYNWRVVRERHWGGGWVEWIAVHPDAVNAVKVATEAAESLELYPVLDDDLFSEYESDDES